MYCTACVVLGTSPYGDGTMYACVLLTKCIYLEETT